MSASEPPAAYGQLVDIGGRRLCARVRREGPPAVVFESGAGTSSFVWALVEEEIASIATTVCYDRAGIGWSDPGPQPRDAKAVAADLDALLRALDVGPPFVLVAHSLGGLFVRAFYAKRRDDVAGIVFVDCVDEHTHSAGRAGARPRDRVMQRASGAVITLADRTGLASAVMRRARAGAPIAARPDIVSLRTAFWHGRNRMRGTRTEGRALEQTARQVSAMGDLGDTPIAVVHADDLRGGFRRLEDIWRATQARLAVLSTTAMIYPAGDSSHFVQIDRADVVTNAITDIITRSRG